MRVLLLGAGGQLGHDIRRAHGEAGEPFELLALGRGRLDLAAPDKVEAALAELPFDALVNCTGYHRTDEAEDNAALAFAVNAHAVAALARACAARRARFVHIGTDYVFGGDTARVRPLAEGEPMAPVNVYGASKAMGETLALLAWEDVVVLRVASLFGTAGASGKGGNFVETMIRVGREKGALSVVCDQTMSPTATADVAPAVLRALTEGLPAGIYHAVNGGQATWFAFAREILRQAGVAAEVAPCSSDDWPTRARRPRYSALDNGRLAARLGPMPPWQEALGRYLAARRRKGAR